MAVRCITVILRDILIVYILSCAVDRSAAEGIGCPLPWFSLHDQCFLLVGAKHPSKSGWRTWASASDYCATQAQDGSLAHPNNIKALADYIRDKGYQASWYTFWLSGSDLAKEGNWLWFDGSTITNGWRDGEPNNANGEDCLGIGPTWGANSLLDMGCEELWPFVCERKTQVTNTKGCEEIQIEHGSMIVRGGGILGSVNCDTNYTLVDGDKTLSCKDGNWGNIPKCVGTGCPHLEDIPHGYNDILYDGAMMKFRCKTGYILDGSPSLACNGSNWNSTVPTCKHHIDPAQAMRSCSFEEEDWCGWKQDDGVSSWQRRSGGPVQPGSTIPETDHTTGNYSGHFLYVDAAESHSKAMLYSPVFPPMEGNVTCFVFYYHFMPSTEGYLTIHLINEETGNKTVGESLLGQHRLHHVTVWSMYYRDLTHYVPSHNFQILLEVKPGTGYNSDTAIDDVALASGSSCIKYAQEFQKQEYPTPHVHVDPDDTDLSEWLGGNHPSTSSSSSTISTSMTEEPSTQFSNITHTSYGPDTETSNLPTTGFDMSGTTTETPSIETNSPEINATESTVSITETPFSPSVKSTASPNTEHITNKQSNFSTQQTSTINSTSDQANAITNDPTTESITRNSSSPTKHSKDIPSSSLSKGILVLIALLIVVSVVIIGACITLRYKRKRRKYSGHERLLDEPSYSDGAIQFQETRREDSDDDRKESEVLVSYKVEGTLDDDNV